MKPHSHGMIDTEEHIYKTVQYRHTIHKQQYYTHIYLQNIAIYE